MYVAIIFGSLLVIPACFPWFWRLLFGGVLVVAFVVTTFNVVVTLTPVYAIGWLIFRCLGDTDLESPLSFAWWAMRGGYIGLVE